MHGIKSPLFKPSGFYAAVRRLIRMRIRILNEGDWLRHRFDCPLVPAGPLGWLSLDCYQTLIIQRDGADNNNYTQCM